MQSVSKTFLNGLLAILPISLSLYAVYWLGTGAESLLGGNLKNILPEGVYVPGLGVLLGLAVVFLFGIMLRLWLVRRLLEWIEKLLDRIPLVKSIYGSIRDLMSFFSKGDGKEDINKVVLVSLSDNRRILGLVTREQFDDLPPTFRPENEKQVAVYIPMSYQIGGFTYLMPASKVEAVNLTIEEAMRFALTAGVTTKKREATAPGVSADTRSPGQSPVSS